MQEGKKKQELQKVSRRLFELEGKERLFQVALDALPDAVEIIDREFNVLYMNYAAKQRTGESSTPHHEGEKCYKVFYNRNQPCFFCPAKETFETGKPGFVLLKDVQIRSTEPCFEELLSLPVKRGSEAVEWVVEIAKDVTKEKELEQQLINSDRLVSLGGMAASIAHEFNNPLGIILGFTQDLLTEVDPGDPRFQSLKIIEEEAQRCKRIMRDLLEFGRPTPAQFSQVDMGKIIRKTVDLLSSRLQKGKIQVEMMLAESLPKIWADPQQLEQVMVNLSFNATEAMPDGGRLTFQASLGSPDHPESLPGVNSAGPEIRISVSDTGHGIDPGDLPKIFNTFFTTKQKKGMGLGLSVCESIIKAHNGRITVESSPGRGTTFYLFLPLERRKYERSL